MVPQYGALAQPVAVSATLKLVVPGIGLGLLLSVFWGRLGRPLVVSARRRRTARLRVCRRLRAPRRLARRHSLRAPRVGGAADCCDAGGVVGSRQDAALLLVAYIDYAVARWPRQSH